MKDYKLNGQIGIAGELRIMSELLLRGFNPAKSYLDNGIDIVLDDGKKVQIKTSSLYHDKYNGSTHYHFTIRPSGYGRDKNRKRMSEVDFVIGWCIEDNVFYIIPSKEIGDKHGFNVYPNVKTSRSKLERWRDRWDLLKKQFNI